MGKNNYGGARIGAGRKPAQEVGKEKKKQYPLSILPSVIEPFKEKYGRAWSQRVQELIAADLQKRD